MAKHKDFTVATDCRFISAIRKGPGNAAQTKTPICFTAILPARHRLSSYSQEQLDQFSQLLDQRPRKTLGFQTPADKLQASVASTV
jgi:hypothetical protein